MAISELRVTIDDGSFPINLESLNAMRGIGISSVKLNSDYTLTFTFTDGAVETVGPIRGATGAAGRGIQSTVLNGDYTLTFTFTDGTTYTTPSIRGKTGSDATVTRLKVIEVFGYTPANSVDVQTNASNISKNTSSISTLSSNKADKSEIPTKVSQLTNDSGYITGIDSDDIENAMGFEVASKDFVNSSIATNTANFIGTFNSESELNAYSGTITNNDYAFVISKDTNNNSQYSRYKYSSDSKSWQFEYTLNNSSFTSEQWDAIQSGITSALVTKLNGLPTTDTIALKSEVESAISTEASAREGADNTLQSNIDTVQGAVDTEKTTRESEVENLQTQIDNKASVDSVVTKFQGTENTDKVLAVNEQGNVAPADIISLLGDIELGGGNADIYFSKTSASLEDVYDYLDYTDEDGNWVFEELWSEAYVGLKKNIFYGDVSKLKAGSIVIEPKYIHLIYKVDSDYYYSYQADTIKYSIDIGVILDKPITDVVINSDGTLTFNFASGNSYTTTDSIASFVDSKIEKITNTGTSKVSAGKVWTSTATGAEWKTPTGGSGGGGSDIDVVSSEADITEDSQFVVVDKDNESPIRLAKHSDIDGLVVIGDKDKAVDATKLVVGTDSEQIEIPTMEEVDSLIVGDESEATDMTQLIVKATGDYVEVPSMAEFNTLSGKVGTNETAISSLNDNLGKVSSGWASDLNSTTAYFVETNNVTLNTPYKDSLTTATEGFCITTRNISNNYLTQVFICNGSTQIFTRRKANNWTAWYELALKSDLTPTSATFTKNATTLENCDMICVKMNKIVFVTGTVYPTTSGVGTSIVIGQLPYTPNHNGVAPIAVYTNNGSSVATGEIVYSNGSRDLKMSVSAKLWCKFNFWYGTA